MNHRLVNCFARKLFFLLWLFCLTPMARAGTAADTLRIATYTYSSNNRLANLSPLADHLSKTTGLPVVAVSYPTVQALLQAIINDSVDFAMMNTSGYLVLQKNHRGKVKPLLNLQMKRTDITDYGACIVAAKSAGLQSLGDIKASAKKISLALVSPSSTSGNLVPRLLFNAAGIPSAETVFDLHYAGTHKKAMQEVLEGRVLLAGCGCAEVDSARTKTDFNDRAVLIASYNDIPLGPVVARKGIDKRIQKAISRELLQVHKINPNVFRNFCAGWTEFKDAARFKPVTDKDYNRFRKLFGNNKSLWKLIE